MKKTKIAVIGTGGTIVSSGANATQMTGYSITDADIHTIMTALPELNDIAEIATFSVFNIGSSNIKLSNWLELVCLINKLSKENFDGFVVTHGTDTMEETAFFANLTLKTEKPVVFTGSMKPATAVSADGPLNLLNAVRLAGSPKAAGKGVLVSLNGTIHGARDVVKTNTVAVETFKSPNSGPLGYIIGDQIDFLTESVKPHTLRSCFEVGETDTADEYPRVCALLCCADQNPDLLEAAVDKGFHGIVLSCTGNGSVPLVFEPVLQKAHDVVCVRSSRTGSGPVTEGMTRWQVNGMIPSGTLNPQKARILLQLNMYDLLLKNAWVVDPLNSVNGVADVAIQDSKIAKVQRDITEEAKEVIDFTGKTLQPGIIDSHVHLGEMWGSPFGPRMLAMNGVTTCLDMAGPLENILDNVPKYGVGINMAILQFASPPFTFKDANPSQQEMIDLIDKSLEEGALGVKLLGGHYPLEPEVSSLLKANPNIFCESYVSPKNGTRLTCDKDGKIQSKVTGNCLRAFGFTEDKDGVRAALLAGKAFVVYDAGGYSDLMTGEEALRRWEAADTNVGGSFNINPPLPRIALAQAKRDDGSFVVDAISTDGGCIPRNVILSQGLSLVKLDILSLSEFAQKTSLNPARMLRLANKGHLSVGADADITVYDYATQMPVASFIEGRKVLFNGELVSKGATVICTEHGKDAIEKRGMKAIVVDPGKQIERITAL